MNKKIITISTFFLMIIFTLCPETKAYDDKTTHIDITEVAVSSKKCGLDEYLKNNLELFDGYETKLNGKKIINWLMDGSEKEDSPMCRATSHFHDPLIYNDDPTIKWWMSGLSKNIFFTEWYCVFTGWPGDETVSAVTWAAA